MRELQPDSSHIWEGRFKQWRCAVKDLQTAAAKTLTKYAEEEERLAWRKGITDALEFEQLAYNSFLEVELSEAAEEAERELQAAVNE